MADEERDAEAPDPAGAAARSATEGMAQLAAQMREMADRMLAGGLPGWPVPAARPPTRAADPAGEAPAPAEPAGPAAPGLPAVPPMPGLPPTPVTMSARQVQAVVDDLTARRTQVRALVAQLEAFDEQLGTLETALRPLLAWLRTWADMEGAVTDFWTPKPPRS